MTDDPSIIAGTFQSRRMLDQSEKAMEDILAAFELMAERMLAGDNEMSLSELTKARISLAQVRSQLVDEVNKHENRILQSKGLVADAPLDFDKIRGEIGRRLDCIREAEAAD